MGQCFRQLEREKARLELYVDGSGEPAISVLVGFINEPKRAEVLIDELLPSPANNRLARSGEVDVRASVEGGEMRFSTRFLRSLKHNGHPAHALAIPKSLIHHQMREYFRVPTAGVKSVVEVLVGGPEGERVVGSGKLFDVSKGGIAAEFKELAMVGSPSVSAGGEGAQAAPEGADARQSLSADQVAIRIRFSDQDLLQSAGVRSTEVAFKLPVTIRTRKPLGGGRGQRVGFMFTDVKEHTQELETLGKLVFAIERRMLRSKVG